MGYSQKVYKAVAKADMRKLGVRLGAVCIDAAIPVQVIAKWTGTTRQGVYYWFFGQTEVAEEKRARIEQIVRILLRAVEDERLPAKTLAKAMDVVKEYRSRDHAHS